MDKCQFQGMSKVCNILYYGGESMKDDYQLVYKYYGCTPKLFLINYIIYISKKLGKKLIITIKH